ncbi:VanZ family protein [Carnobacterium funditum]|uniref:VanZ family protein n=1 Tax=Carnobacterium funditum TaxID=2752 RepID=UPI001FE12C50|nr:VanZ family protein [Carnobacterium funditum]
MLIGFCFSFSIEMLQFFLGTGITDIDDLIFNTIGTMIGLIGFMICKKISELYSMRKREKKYRLTKCQSIQKKEINCCGKIYVKKTSYRTST